MYSKYKREQRDVNQRRKIENVEFSYWSYSILYKKFLFAFSSNCWHLYIQFSSAIDIRTEDIRSIDL